MGAMVNCSTAHHRGAGAEAWGWLGHGVNCQGPGGGGRGMSHGVTRPVTSSDERYLGGDERLARGLHIPGTGPAVSRVTQ